MSDITIISGADGPPGADGRSTLSGHGVPSADIGNDGDFYLDLDTYDQYGPKALEVWPTPPVSLIGPPGPASSGNKRILTTNDSVQAGDGTLLYDLRLGSRTLTLPSLLVDVDVTIKDLYGAVDGVTIFLNSIGTLDGDLNPTLIGTAKGFIRIGYTVEVDLWSILG